jgi:hypothetical protein
MIRKALKATGTVLFALALIAAVVLVGPKLLPTPTQESRLGGPAPSPTVGPALSPSPTASPSLGPDPALSATASPIHLGCFDPSAPAEPVVFTNPDGSAGPEPPEGYGFIQAARTLDTFAGIWVNEFRREVHIAVTCDVEGAITAIGHHFPRDQTVFFHLVEHTYAELESILERVFADHDVAEDVYLSYGAVDEKRNVVEIGIDPLTPAVVEEMKRRYGEPIDLIHAPRPMLLPSPWPTEPEVLVAVRAPDDAETMVSCGGLQFPASILEQGDVEDVPADLADDLRAAAQFWGIEFPGLERLTWRLIHRDDRSAAFLARSDSGDEWTYLALERDSQGWTPSGVGGCRPSGVLDEFGSAEWILDPAYPAPRPDATELHILVTEQACASGQPAFGRISAPAVTYAPDALAVTVGVRPLSGGATCPSNPPTPVTVILPEPLGERALLDAGRHPPQPPTPDD